MKRSVSIRKLGIDLGSTLDQQLDNVNTALGNSNVKGNILGLFVGLVWITLGLSQQLSGELVVAILDCQMKQGVVLLIRILFVDINCPIIQQINEYPRKQNYS